MGYEKCPSRKQSITNISCSCLFNEDNHEASYAERFDAKLYEERGLQQI